MNTRKDKGVTISFFKHTLLITSWFIGLYYSPMGTDKKQPLLIDRKIFVWRIPFTKKPKWALWLHHPKQVRGSIVWKSRRFRGAVYWYGAWLPLSIQIYQDRNLTAPPKSLILWGFSKMKKIEPYKIYKTKEDWDETYWRIFREGSRYGKKELLDSLVSAFWFSEVRGFFDAMRKLL